MKATDAEEQMNRVLKRPTEAEAQSSQYSLSPLLAPRRKTLALTQGQENLVANGGTSRHSQEPESNWEVVDIHSTIYSDDELQEKMDKDEEMELVAGAKRSEGLGGEANAEEANMGNDMHNANDVN